MLLVRLVLLVLSLGFVGYGVFAMLAAELIVPTFSGVENGRFVQITGLTALFSGACLASLGAMLAANMFAALSRHPLREMRWQAASNSALWLALTAFVFALLSAVMGWESIYSGFIAASEPVDIYLHPSAIE
ncbi:hypothetical protein [Pseudoteredinibacter isoporae]|uniref:Uncharacterized protein n=1 Tax=Pseudoteredinibacter isoporae TaxID=570281 RepID=A0A7X0JWT1_9GAMM|nr:hypothetical protein [Pseudoteredinibacter isoporae]MBB6522866.1 hypothetical protein [Pseudoteredinibacter isoporae]NHO88392.1 hypothetical protein [Pseudoteredinibacter isoporae]NIB23277.1 hypothetical protein [Pseudoteredinibacter isoporae]